MKIYHAICIEDYSFVGSDDGVDVIVKLNRGQKYTVSSEHDDGTRTVFTRYWFRAPTTLFAGAQSLGGAS
jgi:hypothetical protein